MVIYTCATFLGHLVLAPGTIISNGTTAWRLAADVGSVTLTAEVQG